MKGLFLLCMQLISICAGAQIYDWINHYGTVNSYNEAYSLTMDKDRNLILGGQYFQTITFGTKSVSSSGYDMFLVKFNSSGNAQWMVNATVVLGGTNTVSADHICTDDSGNVYVAGTYKAAVNFNGTVLSNAGEMDIFYAKYNPAGILQWVRNISAPADQRADAITCDAAGNVYLAGIFRGTILLGSNPYTSSFNDDFISRIDPLSGNIVQSFIIRCKYNNIIRGMVADDAGNIYVGGHFTDTIGFESTVLASYGNTDIFFAKYTPAGLAWAKHFGGKGADNANGITTGGASHVYLGGTCSDTSVFDTTTLSGESNYILQADTGGHILWAKIAGKGNITPLRLTTDMYERIFVAGTYTGSAVFGLSAFSTVTNGTQMFTSARDKEGRNLFTLSSAGTTPYNMISVAGMVADNNMGVYFAGWFNHSINFGTGLMTAGTPPQDFKDIFLGRMDAIVGGTDEKDAPAHQDLLVFPNPSDGHATIILPPWLKEGTRLEIVNGLGQRVSILNLSSADILNGYLRMETNLNHGIYQILVPDAGIRTHAKFIVTHHP